MIEIEVGKVYLLKYSGLFKCTGIKPDYADGLYEFKRLTRGNPFEGYGNPLVHFRDAETDIIREANGDDFIKYMEEYVGAMGKLMDEHREYQEMVTELSRHANKAILGRGYDARD